MVTETVWPDSEALFRVRQQSLPLLKDEAFSRKNLLNCLNIIEAEPEDF